MEITVTAKIDAGYHPGIDAQICKGQTYTIKPEHFGEELFELSELSTVKKKGGTE